MKAPLQALSRSIGYGLLIGLCVGGLYAWHLAATVHTDPPPLAAEERLDPARLEAESSLWRERIMRIGPPAAYAEFATAYGSDTDLGTQHSLAHIFGDALFQVAGIAGIAVCDERFGFGCYHSFFGRAIAERGIDIIAELDRACVEVHGERGLGCPHGIGHGILAHLGPERLHEALAHCATLSWQGPIGGCSSGVFMEFNFRTMDGPSVGHRVPLPGESLMYPCTDVDPAFMEACYFDQVEWWYALYGENDAPDQFASDRIGAHCKELAEEKFRVACYRGAGSYMASRLEYRIADTVRECERMPDREGVSHCLYGAAWIMSAQPGHDADWVDICAGLSQRDGSLCLAAKDFI